MFKLYMHTDQTCVSHPFILSIALIVWSAFNKLELRQHNWRDSGPRQQTCSCLTRPALKDRECQPGTRPKSAAKPLKIVARLQLNGQVPGSTAELSRRTGNVRSGNVEDKSNQYNANVTGRQKQLWPASPDAYITIAPASAYHLDSGGGPADSVRAASK